MFGTKVIRCCAAAAGERVGVGGRVTSQRQGHTSGRLTCQCGAGQVEVISQRWRGVPYQWVTSKRGVTKTRGWGDHQWGGGGLAFQEGLMTDLCPLDGEGLKEGSEAKVLSSLNHDKLQQDSGSERSRDSRDPSKDAPS